MIELPPFDTGQYEGSRFVMDRGDAWLTVRLAELPSATIVFRCVKWHQFTALHSCSPESITAAYFRLVEISPSPRVEGILHAERSVPVGYRELHHYMIFLDETGCHEVVSEAAMLAEAEDHGG
jgi:hypothetical protein